MLYYLFHWIRMWKTFWLRHTFGLLVRYLLIYVLLNKKMSELCYLWPGLYCNNETLYFFHWRGWICFNQEKYRRRQSLSVPAAWAKNRGNRAGHITTMRCTRQNQTADRWSLFNWSDHKIQSLISEAAWSRHSSQKKPSHRHLCWTRHFTSPLCWTLGPIHSCFFTQPASPYKRCSVLPQSRSLKSRPASSAPPLSCPAFTPTALKLSASVAVPRREKSSPWNHTVGHSARRLRAGQPMRFIMLSKSFYNTHRHFTVVSPIIAYPLQNVRDCIWKSTKTSNRCACRLSGWDSRSVNLLLCLYCEVWGEVFKTLIQTVSLSLKH